MRIPLVYLAALALAACTTSTTPVDPGPNPNKPSLAERGLSAEISAASLADDCKSARPALADAACEEGTDCSLPCQQTSMQMSFGSDGPTKAVPVKILEVRLLAKEGGKVLDTLSARAPSHWVETAASYQPWDEQLQPNADTEAKYDLSAPNWAEIEPTPNTIFYIEVDVEIDGTVITVESGELSREPQIVT